MDIQTEFSINDKVYYLEAARIESFVVKSINIKVQDYEDRSIKRQKESYSADIYGAKDFIYGERLFKSIEQLMKTVINDFEIEQSKK